MSQTGFPDWLDLEALTARESVVAGAIALADMPRLRAALVSDQGEAAVELRFGRDEARRWVIRGHVEAQLWLNCQRCLQDYPQPLCNEFQLAVVGSESEAERLPDELDPLLLEENQRLRTRDLVEDELILALPVVARHPQGQPCEGEQYLQSAAEGDASEQDETQKPNPFAVLAGLKRNERDN